LEVQQFLKENKYTETQITALEKARVDFHQYRKPIIDKIEESGYATGKLLEKIKDNENYATFKVQKFFDNEYGATAAKRLLPQIGTVQEIMPPATATILQDIQLIQAINWNNARRSVITFMNENFPSEVFKARVDKAGNPLDPSPKQGIISILESGGKVKHFYLPKLIAAGFEKPDGAMGTLTKLVHHGNSYFRQVFINKNVGFAIKLTFYLLRSAITNFSYYFWILTT